VTNTINVLLGFIVVLTTAKGTRQGRLTVANQSPAFSEILGRRGLTGIAAVRKLPAQREKVTARWMLTAREVFVAATTTVGTMIPLGLWIVVLPKCLAKVDPPGWPGIAALRTSRAGSRRATATQTLSARATLCAVKTTVLLLEERTRTGGWTAVCLQASLCRSQNQLLNLKLHRKRSQLWNLEPLQKRSQLQNQNQTLF